MTPELLEVSRFVAEESVNPYLGLYFLAGVASLSTAILVLDRIIKTKSENFTKSQIKRIHNIPGK